jgi:hypothetical protein
VAHFRQVNRFCRHSRSLGSSCATTSLQIWASKGIQAGPIDSRSLSPSANTRPFTPLPTAADGVRDEQLIEEVRLWILSGPFAAWNLYGQDLAL